MLDCYLHTAVTKLPITTQSVKHDDSLGTLSLMAVRGLYKYTCRSFLASFTMRYDPSD